jgi:spermidine/putrescine transport system permease protein
MISALRTRLLMAPAVLVIGVFMAVPMLIAVFYSVMTPDTYGGVRLPLSAGSYVQMLYDRDFDDSLVFTPAYLSIFWRSIWLAAATSALCLAAGLPLAWHIVCRTPRQREWLVFLVTLPFWINTLIRTYCWVLILRDEGLANGVLAHFGRPRLPLLYNDWAVLLGLVYTFLPFMVLPIYSTLERIDKQVIEAAHDLYATRWAVFRRIVWPLARPGAVAGGLLVFAPALGSFLAPDLLGGGKHLLIGSLIQMEFTSGRNWAFGSALSTLVTVGVLLAMLLQVRRRRTLSAADLATVPALA